MTGDTKTYAGTRTIVWEGRYSPTVNGKRLARNVYASTVEGCEQKLAQLIREMKQEIAARKAKAG